MFAFSISRTETRHDTSCQLDVKESGWSDDNCWDNGQLNRWTAQTNLGFVNQTRPIPSPHDDVFSRECCHAELPVIGDATAVALANGRRVLDETAADEQRVQEDFAAVRRQHVRCRPVAASTTCISARHTESVNSGTKWNTVSSPF